MSADEITGAVADALSMQVEVQQIASWPLASSRFLATARVTAANETLWGHGTGASAAVARTRAVMECLERYAQFGCTAPIAIVQSCESLGARAVSPPALGLYSSGQYAAPGFPCVPFTPHSPLEWLEVEDVFGGPPRLIPVEWI